MSRPPPPPPSPPYRHNRDAFEIWALILLSAIAVLVVGCVTIGAVSILALFGWITG